MRFRSIRALGLTAAALAFGSPARAESPLFERDVIPLLTSNCMGCHGGLRQKGDLDLRSIPLMLKGGESGPAVKAGDLKASKLWEVVDADEMPKGKSKLTAAQKQTLKDWIAAGLPTVADQKLDESPTLAGDQKHDALEVAAAIDRQIAAGLGRRKLAAAPRSDDAEFLRRVYIDLTGRVPTAEQAAAFLDNTDGQKRAKLIDTLLATPQFGEQFGRTWRDWIAPPELPSDPNGGKQPHTETQNLGKWIGERVTAGDSWDSVVRQILSVEAEIKNNPQVIFHGLLGEGGKTTPAGSARGVASLFMGQQLQCAQCHDDPYRVRSQQEFWQLAAFFGKGSGTFGRVFEIPPPDPKKKDDKNKDSGKEAKAPKPDPVPPGGIVIPKTAFKNAGTIVQAKFPAGDEFKPAADERLRPRFADWLTTKENPHFAKAYVNRAWFYFFNRGIVHPIDDMRELNPPTHPALLAMLTAEFAASGFDVKHIARCICNSEAYQRTSRPDAGSGDATALTAAFGRMPTRIMTADVLYDSLRLAYADPKLDLRAIDPKDGNTNGESAPVGDAYLEFQRTFCTNKEDAADFTHGIPQLLTMINHPRLTASNKALDTALAARADDAKLVEWLYLGTLSRRPTEQESAEAVKFLTGANDRAKARVGLLWMLVNRSEFVIVR